MLIERFVWTSHAVFQCRARLLAHSEVERAICNGHAERRINRGRADWIVNSLCADGRRFEVIYDHPHRGDPRTVRVVSAWDLQKKPRKRSMLS